MLKASVSSSNIERALQLIREQDVRIRGWGEVPKSVGGGGGSGEHTCMWCGLTPCHAGCLWRRAFRHSSCAAFAFEARCLKLQRATGNGFSMLRPRSQIVASQAAPMLRWTRRDGSIGEAASGTRCQPVEIVCELFNILQLMRQPWPLDDI